MANEFSITSPTNATPLDKDNRGTTTFTVYNASGKEISGRASVETVPTSQPHAAWLQIDGEVERRFTVGGTEQLVVNISAPKEAAPQTYTFRLNMVETENPDEGFNPGPSVTFTVPEPKEPEKKLPIWIIPAVIAAIVVIGVIIWLATRGPSEIVVPDVIGLESEDALETIEALNLRHRPGPAEFSSSVAEGLVARVAPEPGVDVTEQARIEYFLSLGQEPTVPPPPTPDLTATYEFELDAAIAKYRGTWVNTARSGGFLSRLTLTNSGGNLTVEALGKGNFVALADGFGAVGCPVSIDNPDPECPYFTGSGMFIGDPITLISDEKGGVSHELILTVTPDGTTLGILDRVRINGVVEQTDSYALERERPTLIGTVIFLPVEPLPGQFELPDDFKREFEVPSP